MNKIFITAIMLLGILGACTDTYVPQKAKPLNLTGSPYALNVARIDIIDEYKSSAMPPHVEKLSDIPPAEAVRQWVSEKLIARGRTGRAEVVIKDAHIIHESAPKQKTGIEGYFTKEQTERLNGVLEVEIKIYDNKNIMPVASIEANSHASRTMGEKAGTMEKDDAYHAISIDLMKSLEGELDRNIRQHFANYLM